jgi:DNA-binding TFAR19-related protein (PDSD5 family)
MDMNPQDVQAQQLEEMKKKILNRILSKEAYERLARVRLANPQLAGNAELYILQLYQQGKVKDISDGELKNILRALSEKKDISIKRK